MKWYLNPVVVSVGHDDILVPAQAEPVGRVELTLGLTQLAELGPHLHRPHARHQSVGCVGHPQDPGVGVLAQTTLVHLQTGQATAAKSVVDFIINLPHLPAAKITFLAMVTRDSSRFNKRTSVPCLICTKSNLAYSGMRMFH